MTTMDLATLEQYSHRKVWTRDEAAKIHELLPECRYELIEGDLIDKMGQNPTHARMIVVLNRILAVAFPGRVRIQLPITLPEPEGNRSEPEPDVVLVHREDFDHGDQHPRPQDIALLVEVSDSTLLIDRDIKGPLYARNGVETYWIVDVQRQRVLVFYNPANGQYKNIQVYDRHEQIAFSDFLLNVDELFPTTA